MARIERSDLFMRKLRAVWDNQDIVPKRRYAPRSINGGTGWQVYDRKEEKYLKDEDVERMDLDALSSENLATN